MVIPDWVADALCAQTDPEIFFPEKGKSSAEAKLVCRSCPVAEECLEFAIVTRQKFGVWGGLSPDERSRVRRGLAA